MGKRSKRNSDRNEVGSVPQRGEASAPKARRCRCGKEDRLPDQLFGQECLTAYRAMYVHPRFEVGELCYIKQSHTVPRMSFREGVVTGGIGEHDYYDDEGMLQGRRLSYKVTVEGVEFCAPPEMLVKRDVSHETI